MLCHPSAPSHSACTTNWGTQGCAGSLLMWLLLLSLYDGRSPGQGWDAVMIVADPLQIRAVPAPRNMREKGLYQEKMPWFQTSARTGSRAEYRRCRWQLIKAKAFSPLFLPQAKRKRLCLTARLQSAPSARFSLVPGSCRSTWSRSWRSSPS